MQTTILANIPSPPQGVWELGPIPVRAYALCIIAGMLVALWLTVRRYRAKGGDADVVWDAAIVAIPAGIIGGRLYHVITDYDKYFGPGRNPWDALNIAGGGLGIWGAVALGGIGVWVLFRVKKLPLGPFADAVAPGIILAQAIGRLGNWFNQEIYGRPTDLPWALDIFYRVDENGDFAPLTGRSTGEIITSVHPTFLYELLWNVAVFAFLLWAERRFRLGHGRVFALYVAGYTLGRFWIELMRSDDATLILGLRVNTWVSAIVFVVALIIFFRLPRGQETPEEVDPREPEEKGDADDQNSVESGASDYSENADSGSSQSPGSTQSGTAK